MWVATWGAAQQPPDGADDPVLAGATVRQTIRASLGGSRVRLRLSNEYGRVPLHLRAVALARPVADRAGAAAIKPGTTVPVTFRGRAAVRIAPGATVSSDEVAFAVTARSNLTVTMQLGRRVEGITTHPGSRTTTHVAPNGWVDDLVLPQGVPVAHWYFLSALEVNRPVGRLIVLLGDSLTDGRGSTTDGNDRWPDQLVDRLYERERLRHVAIANHAAGGNRVLRDGLGIAALHRVDRDVLACAGATWLVLFEGVNDIGMAAGKPAAQERVGSELIDGYATVVERAHSAGLRVYGATLTPFGGHEYDDPAGLRERTRRRVNAWIRGSGQFDAVLDFDAAVRNPRHHARVRAQLHDGDGLHLNPAGYRALADAVPAGIFRLR
jgi:lysophospholipase L1-like esterase